MRNIALLLLLFSFLPFSSKGTAQRPDLLIYQGDTLPLYANPLEAYYTEQNPRPRDFGISSCWSTACWRGYQALWEIKGDRLYLLAIMDCCYGNEYKITAQTLDSLKSKLPAELLMKLFSLQGEEIDEYRLDDRLKKQIGKKYTNRYKYLIAKYSLLPRKNADLKKLFPDLYQDGKVEARWFSGDIKIPKGKLLQYVHMGYMSTYEKELVINLENGLVIETNEYENKPISLPKDYRLITAVSYSLFGPGEFFSSQESQIFTFSDTITFSNSAQSKKLEAMATFNEKRLEKTAREQKVKLLLDSLQNHYGKEFDFNDIHIQKVRWGMAGYVDGKAKEEDMFIRLYTLVNINSHMILWYVQKGDSQEKFTDEANAVAGSVKLLEFGY